MKRNYITLKIFLLFPIILFSCSGKEKPGNIENWQILYLQDQNPESISLKSDWAPITIPSTFRLPYKPQKTFQYVWLKGEFTINDTAGEYGLFIKRVKYTDSVYINDKLIGSTSPGNICAMPMPRSYPIPAGVLKNGTNSMNIRLGTFGNENPGIMGDIVILPRHEFERRSALSYLIFRYIPFSIVILFSSLVVALMIVFLINRNELILLINSIGMLVLVLYILSLILPFNIIDITVYLKFMFSIIPIFSIVFIFMIQSVYRVYLTNYNRVIVPVFLLIIMTICITDISVFNFNIGRIMTILSLALAIPNFIFLIYRLNSFHPDRFIFYIMILITAIFCTMAVLEILSYLLDYYYVTFFSLFISLFYIPIFSVFFARNTMQRRIELALLYNKLVHLEKKGKDQPITDSVEEKLTRVLNFLKENFKFDISREGLANAVGMNPNYMGSQFIIFTGKKINDYINELRVEEAKVQLNNKNKKVIDIALEVGFESLTTFNRVFRDIAGKTPTEYRDGL